MAEHQPRPDRTPAATVAAKPVLVAYATMAGSTAEVAEAIGKQLNESGNLAEVLPISKVEDLSRYQAVVLGGPMIMGWHRGALRFIRRHRRTFQELPLAVFITCLSLTDSGADRPQAPALFVDEKLAVAPARPGRLSLRERYASVANYIRPILRAARRARLVSLGIFGGRLQYGRLKWWAVPIALLMVRDRAGDRRNWDAIRRWSATLPTALGLASGNAREVAAATA